MASEINCLKVFLFLACCVHETEGAARTTTALTATGFPFSLCCAAVWRRRGRRTTAQNDGWNHLKRFLITKRNESWLRYYYELLHNSKCNEINYTITRQQHNGACIVTSDHDTQDGAFIYSDKYASSLSLSLFSSLIGLIFLYASNDFLDPAGRERGVIWHQELAGFFYTDNDDDDFLFHFFPPFHSLSRESHDFNRQTKKGKYTMTTTCTWKISSQCQLRPPSLSSGAWLAWAVPALSSSLSTAKIRLRGSTSERDWDPTTHFYCWKEDKHHELNGRIFFFILLLKRLVKVKWKRLLDYDSDQMIACI